MTATPLPPTEGWEIDYDKLIADAFANHKYRQGTRECVAFKNGAHWAMHNYAQQARADLEAELRQWQSVFGHLGTADECGNEWIRLQDENKRLREALVSFTKSDYIKKQHPRRYAAAVAALESRP